MTPHEAFYGRKPNLGFARVWGSMVQYREPAGLDNKLLSKAHWGINLGTCPVSKGWVIKDVISGKVMITRDVVFYEEVNYLQWKGVEKEIAAAGTATAPDKVEDLLEEKESEGVGYEGDEELEDVERADSVDWVWEKAPTSEADETNGVEIAGEQPSNEVAEGGNEEVVGEEGDEESAAEGDSDPWKLLNSDDSNVKMREIEELLEEGAIVIGREVKNGEGKALADSRALEEEVEKVCAHLAEVFQVKQIPRTTLFLGMNLERHKEERKMFLYQQKYCSRVQQRFGNGYTKAVSTPLSGVAKSDSEREEDVNQWGCKERALQVYQSMVGSIMYPVSCTRVDMAYAASYLGQQVQQQGERKWREMRRTIDYLLQHEDEGLSFEGGEETLE
ncbi:unnamed protein product [Closterium sp. NIES-64]|nr:unnamed protein product [Closterium sp. NIES-64]